MFVDVVSPARPSRGGDPELSPRTFRPQASPLGEIRGREPASTSNPGRSPGTPNREARKASSAGNVVFGSTMPRTSPNSRRKATPDRPGQGEIPLSSGAHTTLSKSSSESGAIKSVNILASSTLRRQNNSRQSGATVRSPYLSPPRSSTTGGVSSEFVEEVLGARRRAEEVEGLLTVEQNRADQLEHTLTAETEYCAKKGEKIAELTRLVQMSAGLAEQCEEDRSILAKENIELQMEIEDYKAKAVLTGKENDRLESELTECRCDLSTARSDAVREREVFSRREEELVVAREQAAFSIEEVRAELLSAEKKAEASIELMHARHTSAKNALQEECDRHVAAVEDLTRSLEEAVTNSEDSQRQVRELTSALKDQGEKFHHRLEELESIHRLKIDALDQKNRQLRSNEGTLEHHIDVLLSRATALQTTLEGQQSALAKQRAEVTSAQELNHVLAVKLRAALADKEASAMEAETRRILTIQNEEMERQLGELRRTISDLMSRR